MDEYDAVENRMNAVNLNNADSCPFSEYTLCDKTDCEGCKIHDDWKSNMRENELKKKNSKEGN